ncbi:Short-chain dehydrogenase/reductase family oxidoreductase [Rhodococcus sp. AW25M09]|nr:Short-chain dehydrogenase/reductase family oxidoreductase [Rhodococcus sp. AW25M09]
MDLTNSSAVVTGGASGLGLATVKRFVAAGVNTVIVDLPQSAGKDVAQELGDLVQFGPADVADPEAVDAALDLAESRAPLRSVVHCAGRGGTVRVVEKRRHPRIVGALHLVDPDQPDRQLQRTAARSCPYGPQRTGRR